MLDPVVGTGSIVIERELDDGKKEAPDEDVLFATGDFDGLLAAGFVLVVALELIEPGLNGALVESVDEAVAAVAALPALDRTLCRRSFEERFTTARMARNYVGVYKALVEEAVSSPARAALPAAGTPIAVPALVATEERQPAAWLDRTGVDGARPR